MTGWIDQVKAWGVADVLGRLGIEPLRRGRDMSFPCPACGKERRHTKGFDKRMAAKVVGDGGGWWCEPCGAGGSTFDLVALAAVKRAKNLGKGELADVRRLAANYGLCDADTSDGGPVPRVAFRPPPPRAPEPPPSYPPSAEVSALWAACLKLDAMPSWDAGGWCRVAREFLAGRGLDVGRLVMLDVVRILPPADRATWPSWWPGSWSSSWRLAVPLYDSTGAMVTLQARAAMPLADGGPKTRFPRGFAVGGSFFADAGGLELLRTTSARGAKGTSSLVVVEGLTDYLAAAQHAASVAPEHRPAVLGVVKGSAKGLAKVKLAEGVKVRVATDADKAGNEYAAEVRAAWPRAEMVRVSMGAT